MQKWWALKKIMKGRRGDHGNVAVEFALAAPFFLIFVMGIIDFGRLFWIKNTIQYAVEETARYAMVHPTVTTSALVTYAENRISGTLNGATFAATATTSGGVDYRTITAQYPFTYMIPIIPMGDITLSARSSTPVNAAP